MYTFYKSYILQELKRSLCDVFEFSYERSGQSCLFRHPKAPTTLNAFHINYKGHLYELCIFSSIEELKLHTIKEILAI